MIKVVLFDFGGVLTETGKRGFIRQTLAALYGVPEEKMEVEAFKQMWRRNQTDENEVFARLNQHFNKQITPEMFYEAAHRDVIPAPAIYALAASLRRSGIRTGILSNVFVGTACVLRDKGFYEGFEPVILSCDEGYAKPDEELYQIAIERCGVNPDEIVFIDDQEKCGPPAEKAGMHFILATSPEQVVRDVKILTKRGNT